MNYYSTLNVSPTATDDEIKKAYRNLAKTHHPDAGGDEGKFKEITEAYSVLSDPDKRRLVDMGGDPNAAHNNYNFHAGGFGDLRDIFSDFHRYTHGQNYRKNKSVVSQISLTLEEVLTGKEIDAEIALPGTSAKTVSITIPPGVASGQQVKFSRMGDASIEGLPPGDLILHVKVLPHATFERHSNNLVCEYTIPIWDAIAGKTVPITTLEQKTLNIKIKPGTEAGTLMKCTGYGLPLLNNSHIRGDLFVKIGIDIPKNLTKNQLAILTEFKNSFTTTENEEIHD